MLSRVGALAPQVCGVVVREFGVYTLSLPTTQRLYAGAHVFSVAPQAHRGLNLTT